MPDCQTTIEPGQPLPTPLTGVICFAAGEHTVAVNLTQSVTFRGEPGAVLKGDGRSSVVMITAKKAEIRLENLEIQGGHAVVGGGVYLNGYSNLVMVDCNVKGNHSQRGGAGLMVARGSLTMSGGSLGLEDDVIVSTVAKASFEGVSIPGLLFVKDGANVSVIGGELGQLRASGTTTRKPTIHLKDVAPEVNNHASLPAEIVVE